MKLYSNEIVFRGHPDKVCDQISGAILDECLRHDPKSRVGVEVLGGKGILVITGEVTTNAPLDARLVAYSVLRDVGYDYSLNIIDNLGQQSPDINRGVDKSADDLGAGDNGMMFGYATRETKEWVPKAQVILQKLAIAYDELRKNDYRFKPDGKAQLTGRYIDGKLVSIKDFSINFQNKPLKEDRSDYPEMVNTVIGLAKEILKEYELTVDRYLVNSTGRFEIGGFQADAGLTGRKIVVDAYQSFANVGGGCMNGKDPSKVDISGAHKAREIAIRTLKENPDIYWCEVQLSYAIGLSEPLAIYIKADKGDLAVDPALYKECKVSNIIKHLQLTQPRYEKRAQYGHFGIGEFE